MLEIFSKNIRAQCLIIICVCIDSFLINGFIYKRKPPKYTLNALKMTQTACTDCWCWQYQVNNIFLVQFEWDYHYRTHVYPCVAIEFILN